MWTRTGLAQFKQAVRNAAGGGGVLQVGHGETLTVRVPTHEGGRCLFWEFATDNFDIGEHITIILFQLNMFFFIQADVIVFNARSAHFSKGEFKIQYSGRLKRKNMITIKIKNSTSFDMED